MTQKQIAPGCENFDETSSDRESESQEDESEEGSFTHETDEKQSLTPSVKIENVQEPQKPGKNTTMSTIVEAKQSRVDGKAIMRVQSKPIFSDDSNFNTLMTKSLNHQRRQKSSNYGTGEMPLSAEQFADDE